MEGPPWGLRQMTEVEPADSAEEDKDTSKISASKLTDMNAFEETIKIIDKRLINMERKISLVIPLLRKALALKDEM